jgi:CheY-like chemotaxis protein
MVVLYIDDDPEDQEIFSEVIKQIDPSVILLSAKDGDEALRILRNDVIDLPHIIFLDINMPRMDGYACLAGIRAEARLKDTLVVLYSTSPNPTLLEKHKHLNAEVVSKPTTYSGALETMKNFIKKI